MTLTYSYDQLGDETSVTDSLSSQGITTYTFNGDAADDRDPNVVRRHRSQAPTPAGQTARTTTYAYDSMDRLTTTTDPLGFQTILGYDSDGNEVTSKDPLGRVTTTQYDEMDRPTVVIDPMGNAVTTTYDADGEKLTVTDALNRTTTYAYSARGWAGAGHRPDGLPRDLHLPQLRRNQTFG